MQLRTGIDLIDVARIEGVVARNGKHFLKRVFTMPELVQSGTRAESLAGRFAAKEAVAKALGAGIGSIRWRDIEILGNEQNAPIVRLYGNAQQRAIELGLETWAISISHDHSYAIALAFAAGGSR